MLLLYCVFVLGLLVCASCAVKNTVRCSCYSAHSAQLLQRAQAGMSEPVLPAQAVGAPPSGSVRTPLTPAERADKKKAARAAAAAAREVCPGEYDANTHSYVLVASPPSSRRRACDTFCAGEKARQERKIRDWDGIWLRLVL